MNSEYVVRLDGEVLPGLDEADGFDPSQVGVKAARLGPAIAQSIRRFRAGRDLVVAAAIRSACQDASWPQAGTVAVGNREAEGVDQYSVHPGRRPLVVKHRGAKLTKTVYADPHGTRTVPTSYDERMALVLTDEELQQLAEWSEPADKRFHRAMSLEWAKDGLTNNLYVVEVRPWTVPPLTVVARGRTIAVPQLG
ncbi:PEP/pyruvate-binding domain-containing protein [Kribbella sp. NPDC048928]|uniref:PEP/pyruvate-binding domain-containing protein n=1 Tax=Kribbella sp. NPDC048928 TaxID=3364111 RepID=UPI003718C68C